jgi:hypothetical protein
LIWDVEVVLYLHWLSINDGKPVDINFVGPPGVLDICHVPLYNSRVEDVPITMVIGNVRLSEDIGAETYWVIPIEVCIL